MSKRIKESVVLELSFSIQYFTEADGKKTGCFGGGLLSLSLASRTVYFIILFLYVNFRNGLAYNFQLLFVLMLQIT